MATSPREMKSAGRILTGIVLIILASTVFISGIPKYGYRFLDLSGELIHKQMSLNFEESRLEEEKSLLDDFSSEVGEVNSKLTKAMKQSLQWNDTVQRLMESSLDNAERIQQLYEEKILPGEDLVDSLSALFDHRSDSLLVKMNQYAKHEVHLRQEKLRIADIREKRVFSLSLFLLFFSLFTGFIIAGAILIRKGLRNGG